jgi:hypothetical protein
MVRYPSMRDWVGGAHEASTDAKDTLHVTIFPGRRSGGH